MITMDTGMPFEIGEIGFDGDDNRFMFTDAGWELLPEIEDELIQLKEKLRKIEEGEVIVVPMDQRHADMMVLVGAAYGKTIPEPTDDNTNDYVDGWGI